MIRRIKSKNIIYSLVFIMLLSAPLTVHAGNGDEPSFYEKVKTFIFGNEEAVDKNQALIEFRQQFNSGNNNMSEVLANASANNGEIYSNYIDESANEAEAVCASIELEGHEPFGPYNISTISTSNNNYGFGTGQTSSTTVRVNVKLTSTDSATYSVVGATLVSQGEHTNVWVVNPDEYYSDNAGTFTMSATNLYTSGNVVGTDVQTVEIATKADIIYEKLTSIQPHAEVLVETIYTNMPEFGDIDKDGRINLILYDIASDARSGVSSYTAGYFWAADYYNTYGIPAIDSVHMDIGLGHSVNASTGEIDEAFYGTFAHEFQHSLFYTYFGGHVSSTTPYSWVNEGLSGVADLYYSDYTTSSVPDSQNLSFSRIKSGTLNSYESGTSYGDFVNFNGLKGYGMSYMMSAMMEERAEGYINKAYEYFLTNLVKSTSSEYTYHMLYSYINYNGKSVQDIWGEVFRTALGSSVDTSGLTSDEVMEYVYTMFMESYMSAGGQVIDNDVTVTTDRIWRNGGSLWSFRNGNRYYYDPDTTYYYTGNTAYETVNTGGAITLVGYPSNSTSIEATHEMAYTLNQTSYDVDDSSVLKISIPETEGLRAYVALYDANYANPKYGTSSKNYSYDPELDTANLYPIELGVDNYVKVGSESIVPHLFVFTYYKDVNTTVEYDWVEKDITDQIDISSVATVILSENSYYFNNTEITPSTIVQLKDGNSVLEEGTDYTVTITNNINAGTATVTITGIGDYEGSLSADFEILPISIVNATIHGINNRYDYTGAAITPAFTVTMNNDTLQENKDYTYTFSNNTATTKKGYLTVEGIGNYKESVGAYFEIYE